jgi:hypothetical protein
MRCVLTTPCIRWIFRCQSRGGWPEVVRHPIVIDDNAVHLSPIPLPSPPFLSTGRISFDKRSRKLSGQATLAMWTPWSRASLETPTTLARQEIWLHCGANFLLSGAIGQPGHPLIPFGEDCGPATGVAIGIHRLSQFHSGIASIQTGSDNVRRRRRRPFVSWFKDTARRGKMSVITIFRQSRRTALFLLVWFLLQDRRKKGSDEVFGPPVFGEFRYLSCQ